MKIPIINRLVPSVRKRVARVFWPGGWGLVRRDGVLYLINAHSRTNYDKYLLLREEIQEPEQRAFLLKIITERKCDMFIDIGANYGLYTASVALQTDCPSIVAYEPSQRSYDRLRANLRVNHLTGTGRVATHMLAISDRNGAVQFVDGPAGDDFISKVVEDECNGYSVPAARLDDALPLKGHRIALKIDVEGHELAAFAGMKSLLRSNDCFLQVECWKDNAAPFIAAMEAEGYRLLHRISDDHYFAMEAIAPFDRARDEGPM